jgi:hypothetical protein
MLVRQDELEYYKHPGISNSALSLINSSQAGSPQLYKLYKDGKILRKPQTLSLENGSLLHLYCEKPELFEVSHITKPNESIQKIVEQYFLIKDIHPFLSQDELLVKAGRLAEYYNKYKDETLLNTIKKTNILEYIEEIEKNNEKHILTAEQKITIENCINSLKTHGGCNKYLFEVPEGYEVYHELEIYFEYLGQQCKNRLDRVLVNHDTKHIILVDLKTTSKRVFYFRESWEFFHYYRQPAFYKLGLSTLWPGYKFDCYYPVVDTKYYTRHVYKISDSELDRGEIEYNSLINLIKWHEERDEWNYTKEEYENNLILNL